MSALTHHQNPTVTVSSEVQIEAHMLMPPTKEEMMFMEHEIAMAKLREKEEEQALNDSQFSKQPISFSGQNDISNSVWVDR